MEFLADVMMKKAGRWLRILGYDVAFPLDEADDAILEQAKAQGRTLLTKDEELARRAEKAGIPVHATRKIHNPSQVAEILLRFGLKMPRALAPKRCPACNGVLRKSKKADREKLERSVHPNVLATKKIFWICPDCGHVFWKGTHWDRIVESSAEIRAALKEAEETKQNKSESD
jgi:hypothetical protein